MKKLLASLVALSLIASPTYAMAGSKHRHYSNHYPEYSVRHYPRPYYHDRYRNRNRISTGEAILIIGAVAAIGAAVSSQNDRRHYDTVRRHRGQTCQETYQTDSYGNLRSIRRECW